MKLTKNQWIWGSVIAGALIVIWQRKNIAKIFAGTPKVEETPITEVDNSKPWENVNDETPTMNSSW